jgi:hypothetical protein
MAARHLGSDGQMCLAALRTQKPVLSKHDAKRGNDK